MNEIMERLMKEEDDLQFEAFTNDDALNLGLEIINMARQAKKEIAVYVEINRQPVFAHFMKGTYLEIVYWIKRKKNVVDRYGHSSAYIGEKFNDRGSSFEKSSLLDPSEFQAVGGAFPILLKGTGMIGSITVSGLSEDEDHSLCVEGMKRYIEKI